MSIKKHLTKENFKIAITRIIFYILSCVYVFAIYLIIGFGTIFLGLTEEANLSMGNDKLNIIMSLVIEIIFILSFFLTFFLHDQEYKSLFLRMDKENCTPRQTFIAHIKKFGLFDLVWLSALAIILTIILSIPALETSGIALACISFAIFSHIPWLFVSIPLWIIFNVAVYLPCIYFAHKVWHRKRKKLLKSLAENKQD